MYLHCASELLLKTCCTVDMSPIQAGLNHYTVEYVLNSIKLKAKVVEHWSVYWKTMEDCFNNMYILGMGYERAKEYSTADFHTTEAPVINEVKSIKELEPCFKCSGPRSRVDAWKIKITPMTNPKSIRKLTILTSFIKIIITVVNSLQAPYYIKCQNKSNQVMTFLQLSAQQNVFSAK